MELISIARTLYRKPTGALLVALQIAVSLAIVINAALFVHTRVEKVHKDNGMDTENIIVIETIGNDKTYPSPTGIAADIKKIMLTPGVLSASTINQVPESGSGSGNQIKNAPQENAQSTFMNHFQVGEGIVKTLGLKLIEGRHFLPQDVEYDNDRRIDWTKKIIITRNIAEKFFPGESAVGKLVYDHLNQASEVIGVVEHMHGSWPSWEGFTYVALLPVISANKDAKLLVRVEPGMTEQLQAQLEASLSEDQSRRLITQVTSMQAVRNKLYNDDISLVKLLLVVIALLITVSALGVVALASFTVKQRSRQIGTRRAIGARKGHIVAYFLQENNLICFTALMAGSALAILLNMLLVKHFSMPKLAPSYFLIGCLVLWLASVIAVYRPAKVAASISPVVATRNV